MTKKTFHADIDSPKPSAYWLGLNEQDRIKKIQDVIVQNVLFEKELCVISAKNNGEIVVRILNSLSASTRGTLLLNFEEVVKKEIDEGLTVWGEALGDKNSLRNLRGIEVRAS